MRSVAFALLFMTLAACDSRPVADSAAGLVCRHAGGQCRRGGAECAASASASVDDCNPDLEPGGAFCCLDVDVDAGVVDAPAGTACAAATGRCLLTGFSCDSAAPDVAQDCVDDGAFCCLYADAGVR